MDFEKITIIIILIILLSSFLLVNPAYNKESTDLSLVSHVKHIAKEIGPRPAGSESERETAHYLKSKFDAYGVKTEIQGFKYYSMDSKDIKRSENVIGTINGTSPKQIIICADLDTYYDKINGNYIEGANDDATGLALLIGLAKHYQQKKPYYTIKLIGFGAGEDEYTFPVDLNSKNSSDEYNKIIFIPYLVGARHYVLQNPDSVNNTIAVISLEAVGIGDPCFVNQDSFVENDPLFVNFLVSNTRFNGFNAEKIDFMAYNISGREVSISHIYLPFAYSNIPSTFLTCMENANTKSMIHDNSEIPGYLTVNDTYKNLVKNNGDEIGLQNHLNTVFNIVTINIDQMSVFYALKEHLPVNEAPI
ncbi:MAG: M28 family peptidase [Methanobacterium sp.]|nr:M28 family peptidase [Methanobacterium sp.]